MEPKKYTVFKKLVKETDVASLEKVEIAILFWNRGFEEASSISMDVIESYDNLANVKNHMGESLNSQEI